jgi:hypothetical protein
VALGSKLTVRCQHLALAGEVDALHLGGEHALEAQRRAPPHELGGTAAVTQRVGPVEAVAQRSKAPFCRQIGEVADLEQGILQVRGDHGEVVGIQRNELQLGHWQRASLIEGAVIASCGYNISAALLKVAGAFASRERGPRSGSAGHLRYVFRRHVRSDSVCPTRSTARSGPH